MITTYKLGQGKNIRTLTPSTQALNLPSCWAEVQAGGETVLGPTCADV